MKKVSLERILDNEFKAIEINKKTFNLTGYKSYLTITSDVIYIGDEQSEQLSMFIEKVTERTLDRDLDVQ